MDYIDEIVSILSQFSNRENLTKNSVIKNEIILFSSLLRIRIIAKLEDRFQGLDFCWISENTTVNEINEFIKNKKIIKLDTQINNSAKEILSRENYENNDISLGVDIESLERLPKTILDLKNTTLRKKLFSEKEILYSIGKTNFLETLTGIICAKEACMKAFSKFIEIDFNDIEIDHDIRGRPIVFIRNIKSSIKVDLSISHSSNYALAVCIVYNSL